MRHAVQFFHLVAFGCAAGRVPSDKLFVGLERVDLVLGGFGSHHAKTLALACNEFRLPKLRSHVVQKLHEVFEADCGLHFVDHFRGDPELSDHALRGLHFLIERHAPFFFERLLLSFRCGRRGLGLRLLVSVGELVPLSNERLGLFRSQARLMEGIFCPVRELRIAAFFRRLDLVAVRLLRPSELRINLDRKSVV